MVGSHPAFAVREETRVTIEATPRARYTLKTDPACAGDRHAPRHESYIHGCRCPDTVQAESDYQAGRPIRPAQGRRGALPSVHDNPLCGADQHRPTQDGWNRGCRCSGAMAAHERWLNLRRARRVRARANAAAGLTGCSARKHGSVDAFSWGCRCPDTLRKYAEAKARKTTWRDPRDTWRRGKMAVDRNNLWLLLHGIVDSPTLGERMAAVITLTGTLVPASGSVWTSRPINDAEIARRLGCCDTTVKRLREKRAEMRELRTARRLADVQGKAHDARKAPVRKAKVAARHRVAAERKAAWKAHCRTMRRLRESQERAKRVALAIERHRLP